MLVLIPSYEPTNKLIKVITEINKKTDYKILIIDDGSGEKYQPFFEKSEELGCIVLHHKINKGKGESLKTGFKYLISQNINDKVVCADSDGQHHIKDIVRIANQIDDNSNEMVLGVRKFEGSVPLKSRIGNSITALLFSTITKMRITDTQTGLRGYPFSMLPWLISIEGSRFEYEFNLLLKSRQAGITIKQIPILTIYENNNKGTHFHPIRDSLMIYIPLMKFSLSSLASGVLDFALLFIFQNITGSLFLSVVLARLISSIFNYSINKILVFNAKGVSNMQSAPKYFGLVTVNMFLNYSLLYFLTTVLFIPSVISKLLTELTLFVISYTVQNKLIFKRGQKTGANNQQNSVYFSPLKKSQLI